MKVTIKYSMIITCISTLLCIQVDAKDSTAATGADLYRHMHAAGIISDEEYELTRKTGSLSSNVIYPSRDTTQSTQNTNKTAQRIRKDLSIKARKAKAQDKLKDFSKRMKKKYLSKRENTLKRAQVPNLGIKKDLPKGGTARLDYFDENEFPQFNITENSIAADTISTDEVWPAGGNGFNLDGTQAILGIWDGGAVRVTHQEFGGRIIQQDDALINHGISGHATGVAGTMGSSGLYAQSKGMSYAATIHAYDWDNYLSELADSMTNDVYASNHSWGWRRGWYLDGSTWYWYGNWSISQTEDYQFGLYDSEAQDRDEFVYDSVYCLPFWSSGNDRGDGPSSQPVTHKIWNGMTWIDSTTIRNLDGANDGFDTIGSRKTAKNIITIGAINDIAGGYAGATSVVMSSFSGFGPTDDGRIKPDLVANGVGLFTPYGSSDSAYVSYSGTSFSTPSASGSLGDLLQLQQQLHGSNSLLWASTWKALLIHTADEAGDHDGPDFRFGWGLMNTLTAAKLMTNNAVYNSKPHIKECTLPDGEEGRFTFLADTTMPTRVTMVWTDVPGAIQPNQLDPTNIVLVNDLDIRVIDPAGTTNSPWRLDPLIPTNAASTGDDIRNNVEQVYIENTTTGLYTVVISHKGSLSNSVQDFSLVMSGNIAEDIDVEFTAIRGGKEIEWVGAVGSIHNVQSITNLLQTNGWSGLSDDISIIRDRTTWSDDIDGNSADVIRFYRINEVK